MHRPICLLFITCTLLLLSGCNSPTSNPPPSDDDLGYDAAHGGGHDDHSGHAHSHESLGPHEGHVLELGDEEYHLEWLHDDESGLVTVYVLDAAMKAEVPIEASTITIDYRIGDESHPHELVAVSAPAAGDSKAARFETTSKTLIEALKMAGQGIIATVAIEIDGKQFTGNFEHGPH